MSAPEGRWERFWFGEASLVRLGAFRIVMMAAAFYALWHFRVGVFQHAEGIDAAFLRRSWTPIYAFDVLGIGPPGSAAARALFVALAVAIVLGAVGLFSRLACAVVAVGLCAWIGIAYSFGKPHHDCIALAFGLLALPLGPVGGRLSVDSLLRRLRRARHGEDPLDVPARAPWAALPLRVTQLTAALGYFFAGASKLAIAGPGWADGYTLQGIMLEYRSPWSELLAGHVALCAFFSVGLLFVQVSFPLVFLGAAFRWFYVPMAVVFHLLAMQTMATGPFITLWFTLAAFVALERVPDFLGRHVARAGPLGRLLGTLVVGAGLGGTAWLYFRHMPAWFALALAPLALTALLGLFPGLVLRIRHDPSDPAARRTVAWLAALDWSRRLELEPAARPASAAALVAEGGGRTDEGRAARRRASSRLPLAWLLAPWLLVRGAPGPLRRGPGAGPQSTRSDTLR